MPEPEFQYIRVTMVKDVAVVEVLAKDVQGPKAAQDLGAELGLVAAQDWAKRLLVNFSRVGFMSSTGFAILFRLVAQAKAEGRQIKLCSMEPGMRLGRRSWASTKLPRSIRAKTPPCVPLHEPDATVSAFRQDSADWFATPADP